MPVVRRLTRRTFDPHTFRFVEEMMKPRAKHWEYAGLLFGSPRDHEIGWKGYLIDSRGVKHQLSASWTMNDYLDGDLEVTVHGTGVPTPFVMYRTGKVTYRGAIQFPDDETGEPYSGEFTFTWVGNTRVKKFKESQQFAFRIFRKIERV